MFTTTLYYSSLVFACNLLKQPLKRSITKERTLSLSLGQVYSRKYVSYAFVCNIIVYFLKCEFSSIYCIICLIKKLQQNCPNTLSMTYYYLLLQQQYLANRNNLVISNLLTFNGNFNQRFHSAKNKCGKLTRRSLSLVSQQECRLLKHKMLVSKYSTINFKLKHNCFISY